MAKMIGVNLSSLLDVGLMATACTDNSVVCQFQPDKGARIAIIGNTMGEQFQFNNFVELEASLDSNGK